MAKIHVDRLSRIYGEGEVRGKEYAKLMGRIIGNNAENVSRAVLRMDSDKLKSQGQKAKRAKGKEISLPSIDEVLPKRSVFIRKGAEKGNLMTDNLRDLLTNNLRQILSESNYVKAKGKEKGVMKPEVIKKFEESISNTFYGYTKKDPRFGMPTNIHAIAVTETRSAVNNIKDEYVNSLAKANPDMKLTKTWRHNTKLLKYKSAMARKGHLNLNGTTIPRDQAFEVVDDKTGSVYMAMFPHDPSLPAGQVISCQCEVIYSIGE